MPERRNFLIAYGERLTEPVAVPPGGASSDLAYSFVEARDRLLPRLEKTVADLEALPATACPNDEAVALLTLHPQSIAKSYYPRTLLDAVGLESVGSRPSRVKPEKWTRAGKPKPTATTQLFVAAPRDRFRAWASGLENWDEAASAASDLRRIEDFRAVTVKDRLRPMPAEDELMLEVVLHASSGADSILASFCEYLRALDLTPDLDRRLHAGGLCFLPLRARQEVVEDVATFSFVRVVRPMPGLRPVTPVLRSVAPRDFPVELPDTTPLATDVRVAVFDGGMKEAPALEACVECHSAPSLAAPTAESQEYLRHGSAVTSALLFGPIEEQGRLERPPAFVDHHRVIDETSGNDSLELYGVLDRIRDVLRQRTYEFVNISIGPDVPVDDTDVHSWTAVLDELLSGGETLATLAVGNDGQADARNGPNRIQPPSDSVNGLSVGATDSRGADWQPARYSRVGPGRQPGFIKPDVLCFGGSHDEPFMVLDGDTCDQAVPRLGTSFAAPAALRLAVAVRACFGPVLRPLALKALLIHCAERSHQQRREDVGWGRLPHTMEELVECPTGSARIVYQGTLEPTKYLRAPIPLPSEELRGFVTIGATFCYATKTDPGDPGNYTRSGLDIVFRPHNQRMRADDSVHARSDSFFRLTDFDTEGELRRDALKWETVLHAEQRKQGRSLCDPVFDVHHVARERGGPAGDAEHIPYALVITVTSPRTPDLYNRIMQRYQTYLQEIRPVVEVPVLLR